MQRTAQAILQDAEETLADAKLGLEMLRRPESRRAGLRNVIVWGRAFTNVLQNLRTPCGASFDAWYKKYQKEMQTNELMCYFYTLRSQILKEGGLRTSSNVLLSGNPPALMRRFPRPKFATNFFIGDQNGGSGWELTLPDGKKEKLYLELPPSAPEATVEIKWSLPDAPKNLVDHDILEMAERFLAYFEGMLSDAKKAFESHKA